MMQDMLDETAAWPIDGYLISSPYYLRPSQRGLLRHFNDLADHASWPIVLYNIPYRTSVNLSNDTLLKLAEHPNIVGMKDCCADRAQSLDLWRRRRHPALGSCRDRSFCRDRSRNEGRQSRRRTARLAKRLRADPVAVCRTEPRAGKVLAGTHRLDRLRRSPLADGRGRP